MSLTPTQIAAGVLVVFYIGAAWALWTIDLTTR